MERGAESCLKVLGRMEIKIIANQNSICSDFIAELRDVSVQSDRMRFRRNLERIGEIMAYEISKGMPFQQEDITTPLGTKQQHKLAEQPIIATILRAGSPMHQGFLNYFDKADNAFVSAYRKHTDGDDFQVMVEYMASPSVANRVLILCDPMLATGSSMVLAYKAMLQHGMPKQVHFASVVASAEGIEFAKKHLPVNSTLWVGDVDEELNDKKYIVPGLGDAGDLAYGEKI